MGYFQLSGTYTGFNINYLYQSLGVTSTGYLTKYGLDLGATITGGAYTVTNSGRIVGTAPSVEGDGAGIDFIGHDANIDNGTDGTASAFIRGVPYGVVFANGTVDNFGKIIGTSKTSVGVKAADVYIQNGDSKYVDAVIQGGAYGVDADTGTVLNFGTIVGAYAGAGVRLTGGLINNGSSTEGAHAIIQGGRGVRISGAGTVGNTGTVQGRKQQGVYLQGGGSVYNGFIGDASASVIGYLSAIEIKGGAGSVSNFGFIQSTASKGSQAGVALDDGGTVINGNTADADATIAGDNGVWAKGAAVSVTNFGSITVSVLGGQHGIYLGQGGAVTNGSASRHGASITGYESAVAASHAAATVHNYGTVLSEAAIAGQGGVLLAAGGYVSNGSDADKGATIKGFQGVIVAGGGGTVVNFGAIEGVSNPNVRGGVALYDGGKVTNGGTADYTALISGFEGVTVEAAAGAITNFGTIAGALVKVGKHGVFLGDGGQVMNGLRGLIEGFESGVAAAGAVATIHNLGTVMSTDMVSGEAGVSLAAGGTITNGSPPNGQISFGDTTALITGHDGVLVTGGVGLVNNFATLAGAGGRGDFGVHIISDGVLNNEFSGVIEGYDGVEMVGDLANSGSIQATGGLGYGVILDGGGSILVNGAANDQSAAIRGDYGVTLSADETLTNFGTIQGGGGNAVVFGSATDEMIVEAGSVFEGTSNGDGGTLVLASGVGTLSAVAGGDVTVSGSMPSATFLDFGTIAIAAGATFSISGAASLALGVTLQDSGVLNVSAALGGGGTLALGGDGEANFGSGSSLTVAQVSQSGASVAAVATKDLSLSGLWNQAAGKIIVAAGDEVRFTGTGDTFAGTLAGTGTVAFVGGSDSLEGATLSAARVEIDHAAVTLSGTIDITGRLAATTANLTIATGGVTLVGGGDLVLSDHATNRIIGAAATAMLANDDRIQGAGDIGGGTMTLFNATDGIIDGDQTVGLTIDTGANTISNSGEIENTGAGGTTIKSALDNAGILYVTKGVMTLDDAVTGTGDVAISDGMADFAAAFSQDVDFRPGSTGTLELAKSQGFEGAISGFSTTGATVLDLGDIGFVSSKEATFVENKAGTRGILTVTDRTHTAKITLKGNYSTSTFVASSDGNGGTKIVDPGGATPAVGATATTIRTHPFIAAVASFRTAAGGSALPTHEAWRPPPSLLGVPRPQFA